MCIIIVNVVFCINNKYFASYNRFLCVFFFFNFFFENIN